MQRLLWSILVAASSFSLCAPAGFCQAPANHLNTVRQQTGNPLSIIQQANALPAKALDPAARFPGSGKPVSVRRGNFIVPQAQNSVAKKNTPSILGGFSCVDSSGHILTTESADFLGPGYITKTLDGDILVPGFRQAHPAALYAFPYLVKYSSNGDIIWSKSFDGLGVYPLNYADAYRCFELADRSLLMVGDLDIPEAFNGRSEFVMWRLDANGNLLWVRTDSCSIWTQYNGGLFVTSMVQDAAGNIYLAGNQTAGDALVSHTFALKMDLLGNILWDKNFTQRGDACFGIAMNGNQLSLIGANNRLPNPNTGTETNNIWCLRMDPVTGDTLWSKAWYPDNPAYLSQFNSITNKGQIFQLGNGNIVVSGAAFSDFASALPTPVVHGIVAEFDPSFNYVQGTMIVSNLISNYYNTTITADSYGKVQYTYLTNGNAFDEDIIYGSIHQGQIVKERVIHQRNRSAAWTSNFLFMDALNYYVVFQYFGDPVTVSSGHEMVKLHDSDTSTICTGADTTASWLEPYRMKPVRAFRCDSLASNTFMRTNRVMPAPVDGNLSQQNACKAVASCDSIRVFSDMDTVCAGAPVTLTARIGKECGQRPYWLIDTFNLQSYTILNDSMLQLIYRDQTFTEIYGITLNTCTSHNDSRLLWVMPADKPVVLNASSFLCPDSTLILRPKKGFSSYTWQDGSIADSLIVNSPGKYYVTVTNTCGTPSSDTTVVQRAPSLNFSVGPDLSICLREAVNLLAPSGYNDYTWKNVSNGMVYDTANVSLFPVVNTTYAISARTLLGCVVKDTLLVKVNVPQPIDLGPDTSLCTGDSLLLNAGPGFINYTWSNGAQGSSIYVRKMGAYNVKAQATAGGCYSTDTMTIVRVYTLPIVDIDDDSVLCAGMVRTLFAGNGFAQYQWQDGSHGSSLQASATGVYWVKVTDQNGCAGGDTTDITQIAAAPSGFLVPDTLICDGYPSKIQASGKFSAYSWSNGETGNSLTTRKGGTYSLAVTNSYGCSATETIAVSTKQCLSGIYFPNAFTPNRDGLNDYYKPAVFGNLAHYQLQIFNRWGQAIFESNDFSRGWGGTFKGQDQLIGAYVWICHYQFEGEKEMQEKGTFLLTR